MSSQIESIIREPFEYLNKLPGKALRSKLIDCFNSLIGASESHKNLITSAIETLHTASLLVDDIEDGAFVRRNAECAHLKFGLALTLNSANLAYFDALKIVSNIPDCASIFAEHMVRLHTGQGGEIYFREAGLRPSMEEYSQICRYKTGGLLALSVKLLMSSTKKVLEHSFETKILELAEHLGLYYQLRDDFCNIFRADASDLIEGKFTLPTLVADLERVKCISNEEIIEIKCELKEKQSESKCIAVLKAEEEALLCTTNLIEEISGDSLVIQELKTIIYSLRVWND